LKRLLVIFAAALAAFGISPGRASASTCGIPDRGTIWVDFADGSVPFWQLFARPGVIAAASNFIYPPQLRALGAKTIYWDMYFRRRVGTPLAPFDPGLVIERANRLYDIASASSACARPLIAENELNGSRLITPWSATNAQYRRNVLIFVQTLAARGARPVLLTGPPYTGDVAGNWWREVSKYADIVRETYFDARTMAQQGPFAGSRGLRMLFRKAIGDFTDAGIPTSKLGLMLGFQTTPGQGGRSRASRKAWLEVTKLQTLAAREIAKELKLRSVWSWGWGVWSKGEDDPDKPVAACVYLWTRSAKLCDGPKAAGPGFNASRIEGQLVFPPGVRCTLPRRRPVQSSAISSLTRITGDADASFTAVYARVVAGMSAPVSSKRVLAAEKAVVAGRFRNYGAYRSALARAHASVRAARGVIGDELRRAEIKSRMRVSPPAASDISAYYQTYGQTAARLVQTKTPAPWLGDRKRGFALASNAPPQIFGLPEGRWTSIRTMLGKYRVRALQPAVPLGTLPAGLARSPISNALEELARNQRYEDWLLAREHASLGLATCRRDQLPTPGVVPLTDYLPFLTAS
jgi:hypothetical protein